MTSLPVTQLQTHWQNQRRFAYELLENITDTDLGLTLPFPESETLGGQLFCMLGTQESWLQMIEHGTFTTGWSCSLEYGKFTIAEMKTSLQAADQKLEALLQTIDLNKPFTDNSTPLIKFLELIEHEGIHQGHLINVAYCHHLKIPSYWKRWALE